MAIRRSVLRSLISAVLGVVSTIALPGASRGAASAMEALAGPADPADLHVMTFNLRFAGPGLPNSWPQRRPVMRNLVTVEQPDLIGTQEGLNDQLRDLEDDLGDRYDYVGTGRMGGNRGEFMAIFFNKERLTRQAYGHFWLSDTPQVPGSETWGGWSIRMVTWAQFQDHVTGRRFYAVNTHLDNASEHARRKAADLIRARMRTMDPALPTILTGDFNTPANSSSYVYDLLTTRSGFRDTWATAAELGPAYGTFHGYRPPGAGRPPNRLGPDQPRHRNIGRADQSLPPGHPVSQRPHAGSGPTTTVLTGRSRSRLDLVVRGFSGLFISEGEAVLGQRSGQDGDRFRPDPMPAQHLAPAVGRDLSKGRDSSREECAVGRSPDGRQIPNLSRQIASTHKPTIVGPPGRDRARRAEIVPAGPRSCPPCRAAPLSRRRWSWHQHRWSL
ncbi:endonuclease/exonuclease/phosphatase family protein [Actinoplanes sp. TRM 88003]|uniref:Endonuclease/exonuclease/phosphatase family protein n=1 Tax=Paractinoplanes aksuensis TaxID=2939490 RepID=A0ABT1DZ18_9ACTN|nr:endonuclease/exonuclease/phosphatase family protein [Actinoplanes aksuensis]MCO8275140.1 endonuclease/exonuclease/phosphatase family protein [Actinoplanes aksuensis]